ncbi:anti-sigma factor [Alloalcanivorax mobilis]|mgnify:CR=1 FL=1|uniref:anti-sigma factor n=1 Tax=Alloalcanivorax mobilis TaxID=2019569 RepID=UPI000B5B153F|nr:anti-sigma factor [Alloalcanivorax mobilis]ASK35450.1 hypothetical protein CEK62_14230 [Alcanivorax sp. N3-2A]|tara:strand:- start:1040 stop:1735 length:696 start_codon:yes stop_codon:yes gene_type:complete
MKPDHYERNRALAAEYVLGTLSGAARRRFQTWMMASVRVRQQVWYWERRFQTFNTALPDTPPPAAVWRRIETRLRAQPWSATTTPWWRIAWPWQLGTLVAATVMVMMVASRMPVSAPSAPDAYLGVVQNQQAEPLWLIKSGARGLRVRALQAGPAGPGKDYQLWLLPRSGAPVSLGVIPAAGGDRLIALSEPQQRELLRSRTLAISLEPAGGSPTGQPTGPVLYQVKVVST